MSIEKALGKLRAAQMCHPNAVQALIDEAITALRQAEAQQPVTGEPVAWSEREQLRHAQAAVVMPMIGPLLDAWENSDREVMSQEPELSKQLKNINSAMEDADTHPAQNVPEFSRIAKFKLDELQKQGFAITGYAIQRGTQRGFITNGGFVGWWRSDEAPSVPEGYVLVPIEPTQAMLNVQTWDFSRFYSPREIWAAMIAAKEGGAA